jgi:hypothetical protein
MKLAYLAMARALACPGPLGACTEQRARTSYFLAARLQGRLVRLGVQSYESVMTFGTKRQSYSNILKFMRLDSGLNL